MIQRTTPGANTIGSVTIEETSGTKSPRTGLVRMIGSAKGLNKTSSADKTDFVTLVLNRMNLSTAHRKVKVKEKGKGKQAGSKPPRELEDP